MQFRPAPPGAWVCKICFWRGSASAPLSIEPRSRFVFAAGGDPCGRPRVFPLEVGTCRADEGEPWNRRVPPTGHESVRPESHSPPAGGETPRKIPQKIPSPQTFPLDCSIINPNTPVRQRREDHDAGPKPGPQGFPGGGCASASGCCTPGPRACWWGRWRPPSTWASTGGRSCGGEHPWILYFLPLGGIAIVLLYRLSGMEKEGQAPIWCSSRCGEAEPMRLRTAPLILWPPSSPTWWGAPRAGGGGPPAGGLPGGLAGPGGASGRQGPAGLMVMCGMSAAFSALFGTPLTAMLFSMEVVSVGVMLLRGSGALHRVPPSPPSRWPRP